MHYEECCCGHKLAAEEIPDLAKLLAKICYKIWKAKGMPILRDKELLAAYSKIFLKAVVKGFGNDLFSIKYDSPDYNMLTDLRNNVYQFAAAKQYSHLKALTESLIDDDGKIRSFSQFQRVAFEIGNQFAKNWLKTEYNSAIAGGQMASKWADIISNPATRYLQFDPVMDGRTTELCSSLHGVIKAVDDPFWNTYYPPNHFNCRSTVKQLSSGRVTPDHEIVHPEKMPVAFKTNLAKTGMIFPKYHPYWIGMPDETLKDADKQQYDDIKEWAVKNIRDNVYKVPNVGNVLLTNNCIKEILHKGHKHKLVRNQCLYRLKDVINESVLVSTAPDMKDNPRVDKYYYLRFVLNGEPSYLNIRHFTDGRMYLYAITDTIK